MDVQTVPKAVWVRMPPGEPCTMNELWKQLEGWLAIHWPEGLSALNPPATDAEIAALEMTLGAKLPQDCVDCLKVHNGQSEMAGGLFDNCEFLSTHAIADQWTVWKDLLDSGAFDGIASEPDEGIRADWWHSQWIPITHNGAGDHHCVDLAPDSGGTPGQVIMMWHDSSERNLQANSFENWFEEYVHAVLSGAYAYSEDYGGLVPIDDVA